MPQNAPYRGRIAPTPSGILHAGNIATFKTAFERARASGGSLVLRIEDIDFERSKPELVKRCYADLKSAGLSWDEGDDVGGPFAPYTQSKRLDFYRRALLRLIELGLAYPSSASRSEIKSLARPAVRRVEDCEVEPIFPTELRPKNFGMPKDVFSRNWRFKVPFGEKIEFFDKIKGEQCFVSQEDFGDFLVWRKCGAPSYELAVVVDDIEMQITEVVRGADLLLSTARQILLYRALGAAPPDFAHCPILRGANGEKLSKSRPPKGAPTQSA
ncbi:MAG: tRNA glutamyl-Q synthetase [Opitutales bacterium]|nr:tRNA glutamyl-Q synthetase [Opitutales bacterium]